MEPPTESGGGHTGKGACDSATCVECSRTGSGVFARARPPASDQEDHRCMLEVAVVVVRKSEMYRSQHETDRRSRRVKRRDTAQSASGDPGRTWRQLGPLRRALECIPGRNLEKIGRTRDEIASQTRVGRRQRNKGRGTHNGAGWRCRGKRRRETGWAHAHTRPSSKRAVCTLWSGGSRRESHLTMMIVCRDDRSATIVRDKNSMSITITRY